MDDNYIEYYNKISSLLPDEVAWRDRQPYLQSHGYMLRPRYQPGWIPSWQQRKPDVYHDEEDLVSSIVSFFFPLVTCGASQDL